MLDVMATTRKSMYDKALSRATKSYLDYVFSSNPREWSALEARAQKHLQVVQHFSDPQRECTCEACAWWLEH